MGQPYIGEIRMFGGNFAPQGWAFCNGQLLDISQNSALFNLIGTTYGGDGVTTFALPNLQSRVPIHQGQSAGTLSYVLAQMGGEETVTLTVQQIPIHSHVPLCRAAGSDSPIPDGASWGASDATQYAASSSAGAFMNGGAILAAGGSQPHDNLPPYLAISFIISLFGVYPSP